MNQAKFEKLSRTLLDLLDGIRDEEQLLRVSCRLLGAEVALLVRRTSAEKPGQITIHHIYPAEYKEHLQDSDLQALREWYDFGNPPPDIGGFAKEGPIRIANQEFPDALVAFGGRIPDNRYPLHEMLLLKKRGDKERYGSYYCWAGAKLVCAFESRCVVGNMPKLIHERDTEKQIKDQYASLSDEVLPDESWDDLKKRMNGRPHDIQWRSYTIWTGYQVRKEKGGKPAEKIGHARIVDSKHIDTEMGKPPENMKIFSDVIKFLLVDGGYSKELHHKLKAKLGSVIKEVEKDKNRMWLQMILVTLEHAWRNLRYDVSNRRIEHSLNSESHEKPQFPDFHGGNLSKAIETALDLLCLTRGIVIYVLVSGGLTKKKEEAQNWCVPPKLRELGRGSLRLYLAQEIAKPGSRLEQLYLDGERTDEHRKSPPELKRTFVVNLSRFMLSIVARLEEHFDIKTRATETNPPVISLSEELDSLLYIVDRFVHVELEVEEQINIQQHLGRQFDSEVQHYLTRPRYRDHLLHVIDVFLLGHLLLNTELRWLEGRKMSLIKHLELAAAKKGGDHQPILLREWMRNWAVASLLHDIGYQIGDGNRISSDPQVWENYFAPPDPVSIPLPKFPEKSGQDPDSQGAKARHDFVRKLAKSLCKKSTLAGYVPRIDKENVNDHGMLSALRIAQIIFHADHKAKTEQDKKCPDKMLTCYRHAIHAMAHHNLASHKVVFDSHPLACLLRLCDELQEWNRPKVNMERVVKKLYLDIQEGDAGSNSSYEMIESFKANLDFKSIVNKNEFPISIKLSIIDSEPWFQFALLYRNSFDAHFDPTTTLLCKAYNLQHLDFNVSNQGHKDLKFSINVQFSSPNEYGNLTEYDIYALFTEKVRSLPLLHQFESINQAEAGLIRLEDENKALRGDCFGILLTKTSDSGHHHGWLPLKPTYFFDKFIEFKEYILLAGGSKGHALRSLAKRVNS